MEKAAKNLDIGCVIVTFNRISKLKKTLASYDSQIKIPKFIIVIDNASTDGTKEYLDMWQKQSQRIKKIVIHSSHNLGGSGGFFLGESEALKYSAEWIMIADDDAYPEPDYLEGMANYIIEHKSENISVVCGSVFENGKYENIHRSQWRSHWDRDFHLPIKASEYKKFKFYPDFVSYVGIVINKKKMQEVGLVDKSNFIWCDDTEHTYRLSKVGKLVCLPKYKIIHDVENASQQLSWKYYYGYRNDMVFFKKHFPSHYPFVILKLFLKTLVSPLAGRSRSEFWLRLRAIYDAINGNMGLNSKYKPGWTPHK